MKAELKAPVSSGWLFFALVALCGVVFGAPQGRAADATGFKGWERDSEYNQRYNVSEFDQFKGVVEEITVVTPLPGMAPGVGLKVRDQDGDVVNVDLGPKIFVDVDSVGLKKGDKVKVKGAWAEIDAKEGFVASKVKKSEHVELKVRRTKDGVPFWTLSPEELEKERQEQ